MTSDVHLSGPGSPQARRCFSPLVTPWSVFFTTPPLPLTSPPHTRWAGIIITIMLFETQFSLSLLSQLIEQWKQIAANLVILVATNLVSVVSLVVFNSLVLLFLL